MKQSRKVFIHLLRHGQLRQTEALRLYGIPRTSLAQAISQVRTRREAEIDAITIKKKIPFYKSRVDTLYIMRDPGKVPAFIEREAGPETLNYLRKFRANAEKESHDMGEVEPSPSAV